MVVFGLTIQEIIAILLIITAVIGTWTKINVMFSNSQKDIQSLKDETVEIKKLFELFSSINVKLTGHDKDISSIQGELTEHKSHNKDSFTKLEKLLTDNSDHNREDHGKLFDKFEKVSETMHELTQSIIKNLK